MSNKEPVQKEQNSAFSSREVAPDNTPVTGIRGRMKKLVKSALGIGENGKNTKLSEKVLPPTLITPPEVVQLVGKAPILITPPPVELLNHKQPPVELLNDKPSIVKNN